MNFPLQKSFGMGAIPALTAFVLGGIVLGQVVSSGALSLADLIAQEQTNLGEESASLLAAGGGQSAMEGWYTEHAGEIQAYRQNVEILGAQSELQLIPYITDVDVPDSASQAETDYLVGRADLMNDFAQVHNQSIQGISAASLQNAAGIKIAQQIEQNETNTFQTDYADEIQAQLQRTWALAAAAGPSPMPIPDPPVIPASSSAQMRNFLNLRYQLLTSQAQAWNQTLSMDSANRDAAMLQWQQQNSTLFSQFVQAGQNLPQN